MSDTSRFSRRRAGSICFLMGTLLMGRIAQGQIVLAESRFDTGDQGWTVAITPNFGPIAPASAVTWQSSGGNPGGYMRHVDPGEGATSYWSAPASYLGDQSAAYGGTLSFELNQSATNNQFDADDMILAGGGLTLHLKFYVNPRIAFTSYQIALTEGLWRVGAGNGPVATAAEVQQVLSSLLAIYIRAEFRSGADTDGLDNVVLATKDFCPASTFDASSEAWWTIGDAANQRWSWPSAIRPAVSGRTISSRARFGTFSRRENIWATAPFTWAARSNSTCTPAPSTRRSATRSSR